MAELPSGSSGKPPTQETLESELESSIECLRQLGIILESYKPENEAFYFDKINLLTEHFRRVYAAKDAVTEKVPIAVIKDYLDKGLDPDLYTKHRLEHAESLNQQCRGRVEALKLLRNELRSEVDRRLGPSPADLHKGDGSAAGVKIKTEPKDDAPSAKRKREDGA